MNEERRVLLQQIFDNVNGWLHFAEAKNAALIAFNVALLASLMSSDLLKGSAMLFSAIIIGLLISIMISLWSFKPINNKLEKTCSANLKENLLHFAYIASLERDEYIKKIHNYYWNEPSIDINSVSRLECDYCEEIIENARIAMKKQCYFRVGFYIALVVIVAIGVLTICLMNNLTWNEVVIPTIHMLQV